MSLVAKGGLTAAVLAVGCAGTYFLMTGKGDGPVTLNAEANTDTDYSGKIGADFKYFLVSPFNKRNEKFWNERLEALKTATNLGTEFTYNTKVNGGFDPNNSSDSASAGAQALNRVCDTVYKKAKTELDLTEENKKKLTTDLFTYCSILKKLPTSLKDDSGKKTYDANKLGKTKEDKLIALNGNDKWWDLKTQEFFGAGEPSSAEFFKKFYNDEKSKEDRKSLKTQCEQAYDKEANTSSSAADKPTEAEVLKYCTLLGS